MLERDEEAPAFGTGCFVLSRALSACMRSVSSCSWLAYVLSRSKRSVVCLLFFQDVEEFRVKQERIM